MFSHPVYLFLREFSLQDSRDGSHLTQDEFHWLVCGVDWQQVKGHDLAKWVYQEEPEDAQSNAITQ
ncbi:transposase [Escherichia coli]|nr:hypothetical protein [Escherichia coli]EFC6933405.1 transposase [Escherichia coli]EFD1775602.1 transposase [Escherichia coli]